MINKIHTPDTDHPHVYECVLTDTFAGEANFSWVKREEITFDTQYSERELRVKIRETMGLTNERLRVDDFGDSLTYHFPRNACKIMFVTFKD